MPGQASYLFRVVVDDHKVRRGLVEVARVDGPGRVVPPVPRVAVVELHAVHVQVVDAALDVDAQPGMGGEVQIRYYQVWETFDSKTVETFTVTSLPQQQNTHQPPATATAEAAEKITAATRIW